MCCQHLLSASGDVIMKPILRDPVFWAFMGCFVTAIALGLKA